MHRNTFLLFFCLLLPLSLSAQVSINTDNSDPDPSAMLDVQSIDKGFRMPSMNAAQRDAILNPAPGLMIYNVDDSCFNYFSGLEWVKDCGRSLQADTARSAPLMGRGPWDERGRAIATDLNGNFYVTGNSNGYTTFGNGTDTFDIGSGQDVFLVKYNAQGEAVWALEEGGTANVGLGRDVATDDMGNVYVTGGFGETGTFGGTSLTAVGSRNAFVAKYDTNGQGMWATNFGSTSMTDGWAIAPDGLGNCYVTGTYFGTATFGNVTLTSVGPRNFFVVKLNTTGQVVWVKTTSGGSSQTHHGYGIAVAPTGEIYVTGRYSGVSDFGGITLNSNGASKMFLLKYDPAGQLLWAKQMGSPYSNGGYDVDTDASGNVYVAGQFTTSLSFAGTTLTADDLDAFVLSYNASGQELWVQQIGGSLVQEGNSLAVDDAGNSYVGGKFTGSLQVGTYSFPSAGEHDVYAAKFDPSGQLFWAKAAGGIDADWGNGISVDPSGKCYLAGYFTDNITIDGQQLTSEGGKDVLIWPMDGVTGESFVLGLANNLSFYQDGDSDPNNELQTLSLSGSQLNLAQGNTVDLSPIDTDTDDQTLSLSGTQLSIADGNTLDLSPIDTDTDDQTLSLSGTQLSIADGNSVDLSPIDTDTDDQTLSLSGTQLSIVDGNTVDLASIDTDTDTDDQTLSLSGTQLSIVDGNTVDLASIDTDTDTDDQTLSLSGTQLSIADGNTVDLVAIDTDTDDQTLGLSGTQLSIADGNTVDLASIDTDTDDQTLSFSGSQLSIADGNSVDLASIDTDTDDQTLSFSGTQLSIADGNSVDLASLQDNLGNHIATQNLQLAGKWVSNNGIDSLGFKIGGQGQFILHGTTSLIMQVSNQNTPTIRLRQTDDSGFLPYTWDMGGNENEFFVRDITGSSKAPFRIKPGSENNRITINGNNVGIGLSASTTMPTATQTLDVGGQIRMRGGATTGFVPVSDANGVMSWTNPNTLPMGNHIATQNLQMSGYWLSNDGDDEGVFVRDNGNVGIGTTNPESMLHLEFPNQGDSSGIRITNAGVNSVIYNDNGDLILRKLAHTDQLVLDAAGNVGIGTNAPTRAKLEIVGSGSPYTVSGLSHLYGSIGANPSFNYSGSFSLYADGVIGATAYLAHSDERIKEIEGISDSEADLETLMGIEVTDYRLIDTLAKGNAPVKKVIAQQVAEVYPQAISNDLTEVVPDIYQRAEVKDGWIMLATDLKVGERVKLVSAESNQVYEVTAVETNRFQVSQLGTLLSELSAPSTGSGQVFVYGREVNDFHTVDYEAISMLNVSATQEQQRRIEELEKLLEHMKAKNAQLTQQNTSFEARLYALEALISQSK